MGALVRHAQAQAADRTSQGSESSWSPADGAGAVPAGASATATPAQPNSAAAGGVGPSIDSLLHGAAPAKQRGKRSSSPAWQEMPSAAALPVAAVAAIETAVADADAEVVSERVALALATTGQHLVQPVPLRKAVAFEEEKVLVGALEMQLSTEPPSEQEQQQQATLSSVTFPINQEKEEAVVSGAVFLEEKDAVPLEGWLASGEMQLKAEEVLVERGEEGAEVVNGPWEPPAQEADVGVRELQLPAEQVPIVAEEVLVVAEEVSAVAEEVPALAELVLKVADEVPVVAEEVPVVTEEAAAEVAVNAMQLAPQEGPPAEAAAGGVAAVATAVAAPVMPTNKVLTPLVAEQQQPAATAGTLPTLSTIPKSVTRGGRHVSLLSGPMRSGGGGGGGTRGRAWGEPRSSSLASRLQALTRGLHASGGDGAAVTTGGGSGGSSIGNGSGGGGGGGGGGNGGADASGATPGDGAKRQGLLALFMLLLMLLVAGGVMVLKQRQAAGQAKDAAERSVQQSKKGSNGKEDSKAR